MIFSEKWLREWVNPAIDTQSLAEQISMAGLEVDGLEPVAGEFSGVVVGHVVECGQHPDADKLRVTKIDIGADELLDIVCGAPNCRQGLKVAVACVGAILPGNFKIKKAKLRGQPSFGMLCSFSELGISDDHDGILELPAEAPIGQDLREYLDLNDTAIEIDLTPNRADCLGLRGVAREVGVLNQLTVNEPEITAVPASIEDTKKVVLDAPQACPRYVSRVIKNVDLSISSPLWLSEKLRRSGIRSIDPVVDVTNYVLLELGHPMHAFDASTIAGDIHVRLAKPEEKLVLLDENEVTIQPNTLVIADTEKPLALAGIFGGLASGVTTSTTDIILESAYFTRDAILGKARQYGLHTDASHRYERGVDPSLQETAMERATALLTSIVGGEVGPVVITESLEFVPQPKNVTLRKARLQKVIGIEFATEVVSEILERLGFTITYNDGCWSVSVPTYRFDINIEEDLIEEVARVYGYNEIPNAAPVASLNMLSSSETTLDLGALKQVLLQQGYDEAITYSFVDPKKQSALFPEIDAFILPHPISSDMSAMRVSLLTGLIDTVSYNQKRKQSRVRIFETGLKFIPDSALANGVAQIPVLAGVVSGTEKSESWAGSNPVDFFTVKSDIERLLSLTGLTTKFSFQRSTSEFLHPGQGADICFNGEVVGFVGALHPQFMKLFGLQANVFVFEIAQSVILERTLPRAKLISKYPTNRRDIAIVVKDEVSYADVRCTIDNLGVKQLVDLTLFDIYTGDGIAEGLKSLAMTLTFSDPEKTLEEADIQACMEKVVSGLKNTVDATLRD
jgi:phenylalanyl-tRNA synthetase beta chain